jgi:hypothetical protein
MKTRRTVPMRPLAVKSFEPGSGEEYHVMETEYAGRKVVYRDGRPSEVKIIFANGATLRIPYAEDGERDGDASAGPMTA